MEPNWNLVLFIGTSVYSLLEMKLLEWKMWCDNMGYEQWGVLTLNITVNKKSLWYLLARWRDRIGECVDLKMDIQDDAEQSNWDGHWHSNDWIKVISRFHY
jgi:hypothetical protein